MTFIGRFGGALLASTPSSGAKMRNASEHSRERQVPAAILWCRPMSLLLLFNNNPRYHSELLRAAKRNLDANEPAIALVTAHVECEVLTEQVISAAFKARGIDVLEDSVTDLLPSNSFSNDRVLAVYVALTDDPIQTAAFWQNFKESSTRRNRAVHRGQRITADEGRIACETAEAMLAHLWAVLRKLSFT